MPLDIRKEFSLIREQYDNTERHFNALIMGDSGTGKTYGLRTARLPVLIHSFDPGGTISLRDEIDAGKVIADTRFELEDPRNPSSFRLWEKAIGDLRNKSMFEHIGTYVIDSITNWTDSIMNQLVKEKGRSGGKPSMEDYLMQAIAIKSWIQIITTLPCDCIVIGHLQIEKDETTGKMISSLLMTGKKLPPRLPLLFDEVYVTITKPTPKGVDYFYLTRNDNFLKARSRLSKGGLLDMYENQDIKGILKKVGYNYEDKPIFMEE